MKTTPFVYALLAALSFGLAPIFAKVGLRKINSETAIVIRQIFVALTLFSITLCTGKMGKLLKADPRSMVFIIMSGIFAGILGTYFTYKSIEIGEVSRVVGVSAAYPLVTFILAGLLYWEQFSLVKLSGIACIVFGVFLLK